ncbi:hypothetical protein O0I10_003012 [Lichtheimia ornata]|uniref:Uncharacterized protein n=1 Tax=Lichtheimia ornata TaxID=688661 RepID=A0AAD7V8E8_9FUNG|nr:uncharacterized protein O0I10_003012 [Lichtheimia ornata]KAJ8661263.1 hypothetical protein O0I10_003012 [Lichtheimia ornata]
MASSSQCSLDQNVSEGVQPFECAMSPIPQQINNSDTLFDNNDELNMDETSFHSDEHHSTRRFVYTFENLEPWPAITTNPWRVGSIDVVEALKTVRAESIKHNSIGDLVTFISII